MSRTGAPVVVGEDLVRLLERPIVDADKDQHLASSLAAPAQIAPIIASAYASQAICIIWCVFDSTGPAMWVASPAAVPVGATFRAANAVNLQTKLDELSWVNHDLRLHDSREPTESRAGPALEELLIMLMAAGPAAWVLEADPVKAQQTEQWQSWASTASRGEKGTVGEQVEAGRARRLLALLEGEAARGLWTARLSCAAHSRAAANRVLGLLLSSAEALSLGASLTVDDSGIPFVTSDVVAAFGRSPVAEMPGLRIGRTALWDLTPERSGPIVVGRVLSPTGQSLSNLSVPLSTINRHTFVAGATGSGKSETVRRLLGQLTGAGVPWMVVEPAKAEYHVMADLVAPAEVVLLKLGDAAQVPLSLNPLEPSAFSRDGSVRRFPLGTHLSLIRSLFEAAFEPDEPFPQILAAALERSFAQHGWDTATGKPLDGATAVDLSYPTLSDLRRSALEVVSDLGYGKEVSDNVRGFVEVRINSLRSGIAGQFFESGHPLDLQNLTGQNVVLQLENLGNERDQAFFIGALLIRWSELLRLRGDSGGELHHVLVIEEAHRLLRNTEARNSSVEQFATLLAEIRSYGEGVIVAEQIPSKIVPDVVKNSALKILHRLPAEDDRQYVGATMNLADAQSRSVVALDVGHAAVHADGMDRPIRVKVAEPPAVQIGGHTVVTARHELHTRLCAVHNGRRPCSVDEIEVGRRLASDPFLRSWADLCVLGRLIGEDMPTLADAQRDRFKAIARSKRRLVCAIGLAVRSAVGGRTLDMIPFFEPNALEDLVGAEVLNLLVDDRRAGRASPEWQVGEFRWVDLVRAIRADERSMTPERLASLAAEARQRGLALSSDSVEGALESLRAAHRVASRPYFELMFGKPSGIQGAMAQLSMTSVADLTAQLGTTNSWVLARLEPAASATRTANADQKGT